MGHMQKDGGSINEQGDVRDTSQCFREELEMNGNDLLLVFERNVQLVSCWCQRRSKPPLFTSSSRLCCVRNTVVVLLSPAHRLFMALSPPSDVYISCMCLTLTLPPPRDGGQNCIPTDQNHRRSFQMILCICRGSSTGGWVLPLTLWVQHREVGDVWTGHNGPLWLNNFHLQTYFNVLHRCRCPAESHPWAASISGRDAFTVTWYTGKTLDLPDDSNSIIWHKYLVMSIFMTKFDIFNLSM